MFDVDLSVLTKVVERSAGKDRSGRQQKSVRKSADLTSALSF